MARYIDGDALLEQAKANEPFNWTDSEQEIQEQLDYRCFISLIESQPTADVAPKSAYDQVRWERDIAIKQLEEIGLSFGEKTDGYGKKSEVAREIFEEIENTIRAALKLVDYSYKHNIKEKQCKKECYEDFLGYVAELKKKYTEEKT